MSKSREQLNSWLSNIKLEDNSLVLDIGVQDKPIKERIKPSVNCSFYTLDIDPKWGANYTLDICQPNSELFPLIDKYNYVFAIEVIEHLKRPWIGLKVINMMLAMGGSFVFSYPWLNPLHDVFDMARYTPEGITFLLKEYGFEVEEISYRRATVGRDDLLSFYKKEGLRVSKIRAKDRDLLDMIGVMGVAKKVFSTYKQ